MSFILNLFGYTEVVICLAALCFLVVKRQWRDYWALGSFLAIRVVSNASLTLLAHFFDGLDRRNAYQAYFYVYWTAFAVEFVLALFIVYGIFRLTMEPWKGLLKFGTILFCVVAGISVVLAMGSAFAPYMTGIRYLVAAISQLQRNQTLVTLCMLLFVFFAMRPAGISSGSKIFGVGLGLGVLAINDLVQSRWLAFNAGQHIAYRVINGIVICSILVLWTAYLALPEPERREIDASSPLRRWNRICLNWYGM